MKDPRIESGVGKGLIFSTWWSFDKSDLRTEGEDGFYEMGTHEGKFIGIRRLYDWGAATYRISLYRADEERGGDWFTLSITPEGGAEFIVGSLRFPRLDPAVPARIRPHGIAFLEAYSNAATYSDIEPWSLSFTVRGDDEAVHTARSEYPAFPTARVPNADVSYDTETRFISMAYGRGVEQVHQAAVLF